MKLSKYKLFKPLLCILIIAILLTYVWPWAAGRQFGSTHTTLTIAFTGAGKGLDPQGNRFDINSLKGEEVLDRAIEGVGMTESLTAAELKKRIFILPQAESGTMKEMLTLTTITGKSQEIMERIVYPTSFTVGLKDMGLPSPVSERKLLDQIMQSYQAQLKARYLSEILSEPAYTLEEILKMDYPEMMMVLDQEAENLLLFINSYANNESQFVSEANGLSFPDVYQQAAVIKNTDIAGMRSLVHYFELTENTERRILYADQMLKRAGVIANKLQGAQLTAEEIIQIYDNSSNYIFASGDSLPVNLEPLENQFYGDLMDTLVDKKSSFIDAKYNQQDILRAIEKLQAGSLTGEAYVKMTDEIKAGTIEAMERISKLRQLTKDMAAEFYESNIGNKIKVNGIKYEISSNGNLVINFLILTALYLLISVLYRKISASSYNRYLEIIVQPFRRKKHAK